MNSLPRSMVDQQTATSVRSWLTGQCKSLECWGLKTFNTRRKAPNTKVSTLKTTSLRIRLNTLWVLIKSIRVSGKHTKLMICSWLSWCWILIFALVWRQCPSRKVLTRPSSEHLRDWASLRLKLTIRGMVSHTWTWMMRCPSFSGDTMHSLGFCIGLLHSTYRCSCWWVGSSYWWFRFYSEAIKKIITTSIKRINDLIY